MAYTSKHYEAALPGQTKTVDPSTTQQTVTPDSGKKLTSVVVNAVPSGTHTGQVSTHTVSNPTVTPSVTGTVTNISSTTKPSGTDGTDYWTLDPSGSVTTSGTSSAKAKAKIGTSGYISTDSSESSADEKSISATVVDGTNRYISKGTITNNTSGGTSAGTINRGSQIKFGAGYNASDKYYTAQANSGSVTVTAGTSASTSSCDGYTSITVNPTPSETKTATTNGTVTPSSGKLLSSVTVSIPTYDGSVS